MLNTIRKNKVKINEQGVKVNVDKKSFNLFKKIRNKVKVVIFLLIYLILFASIITGSGYLIYNNTFSYNDSIFNPDSNIDIWNDYYNAHQKNHQLISLGNTINFLKQDISLTIDKPLQDKVINFKDIIIEIDRQLILNNIEAASINNDNNQLLPNNFFANVIYNPSINFTVITASGQEVNAENYSFLVNNPYGSKKSYSLKMNINQDAKYFGINIDKNTILVININIVNAIPVDINNLSITFSQEKIIIENGTMTTNQMLSTNPWIEAQIKNQFTKKLKEEIPNSKVTDDCYKITFLDLNSKQDFDTGVDVRFNISITDQGQKLGFTGTLSNKTVYVINTKIDLNVENELRKQIINDKTNPLIIAINNKTDDGDINLLPDEFNQTTNQISQAVKDKCQIYFNNHYENFKIQKNDYDIVVNGLKVGNDIFNHHQGKEVTVTIKPSKDTIKFKKDSNLSQIKITILGRNTNQTKLKWDLPPKFQIDGVYYGSGPGKLQNGFSQYLQNKLINQLITNSSKDKGLLNSIKDNSYQPYPQNFTGKFTINGTLDGKPWGKDDFVWDASQVSNPTKNINNLFDLISKTKTVYLETEVGNKDNNRTLDTVKFDFYDTYDVLPTGLLYTIDLSKLFAGIAITKDAFLQFTTFTGHVEYNHMT